MDLYRQHIVSPREIQNYIETDYYDHHVDDDNYYNKHLSIASAVTIINNIYKSSLDENSTRIKSEHIDLLPHQESMLSAMIDKETELLSGPYYNQVGILGSAPGSGKTRAVLAHIAHNKARGTEDAINVKVCRIHKNTYSANIHNVKFKYTSPTLVIVNDMQYAKWRNTVRLNTHLNVLYIDKPKDLNTLLVNKTLIDSTLNADFVLLNFKLYSRAIVEYYNESVMFKRIYVDSPETLAFKRNALPLISGFIWFVSHCWYNFIPHILYYPSAYLKMANPNTFDEEWKIELEESNVSAYVQLTSNSPIYFEKYMSYSSNNYKQVIRCRRSFIDESMHLQPVKYTEIGCALSRKERSRIPKMTTKIRSLFVNNDISAAYYELGVEVHTHNMIIKNISNREDNYTSIYNRLSLKNDCPICFEQLSSTIYLPCCNQYICGSCAGHLITPTCHIKCMYCRKPNRLSDIKLIGNEPSQDENTPSKFEQIVNYIRLLPESAHIVIYANNINAYIELFNQFEKDNIDYSYLVYNASKVATNRLISAFETGKKRIICITQANIHELINLHSATHIITFYKLPYFVKELLISRVRSVMQISLPKDEHSVQHPQEVHQCQPALHIQEQALMASSQQTSGLHYVSFLYQDGIRDLTSLLTLEQAQYLPDFFQ